MRRLGAGKVLIAGELVAADVEVSDGHVSALVEPTRGSDRLIAPGFVDLQVNGFGGVDFAGATVSQMLSACEAMAATGVTACLPTLVTAPTAATCAALSVVAEAAGESARTGRTRVAGAHLEGPFISADRLGAHDPTHRLDPDASVLDRLLAAGPVRRVTLAPEIDGALELVDMLVERGVMVSAGHSAATAEQAHAAFDRGIATTTHHGNAMAGFHHREPGLFGAALVRSDVTPTLIVDGHHLHPDTVRLIFAATGGRAVLVTDAVAPAGTDLTEGRLGDSSFTVSGGAVRNAAGALAGSALTMDAAVRNCIDLDIDPAVALTAASSRPRRLLGMAQADGVEVGAPADLVMLSNDFEVVDTSIHAI